MMPIAYIDTFSLSRFLNVHHELRNHPGWYYYIQYLAMLSPHVLFFLQLVTFPLFSLNYCISYRYYLLNSVFDYHIQLSSGLKVHMLQHSRKLFALVLYSFFFTACTGGHGDSGNVDFNQAIVIDSNYPPVTGNWYKPTPSTSWQWQLVGPVNTAYNVELYDIDLFNAANTIPQIKNQGKKVICYFSAGSSENWRPDFTAFTDSDMGNPLDGWNGERWLDITSANVRSIMLTRLQLAKNSGCDGVEPDNMDAYDNHSGFNLSATDQLNYNRFIANEARKLGLSVGLKNDVNQLGALVEYYDFAVNEQCFQYDECEVYKIFTGQNKPVFNAEYFVSDQNTLCLRAQALGLRTLILPLNLDDSSRQSCD